MDPPTLLSMTDVLSTSDVAPQQEASSSVPDLLGDFLVAVSKVREYAQSIDVEEQKRLDNMKVQICRELLQHREHKALGIKAPAVSAESGSSVIPDMKVNAGRGNKRPRLAPEPVRLPAVANHPREPVTEIGYKLAMMELSEKNEEGSSVSQLLDEIDKLQKELAKKTSELNTSECRRQFLENIVNAKQQADVQKISQIMEALRMASNSDRERHQKTLDQKTLELQASDARYWRVFDRLQVAKHENAQLLETEKTLRSEVENLHLEIFVLNRKCDTCEESKEEQLQKKDKEILSLKLKIMELEEDSPDSGDVKEDSEDSNASEDSWSEMDDVEEVDTEHK